MRKVLTVISKDGTKIAYDRIGHGPIVILVFGALNSRKSVSRLADLLASQFTVISYDRRGRGNSTDTKPYAPEHEIEDLTALISEVGESVYLYGHSSGAAIVLEAAFNLSKQIKKLAIYEAPYTLNDESRKVAKEYNKQLKKVLESGGNGDAVALFVRYVGVSDKQIRAMKKMPMWRGLEALAPTLAYDSDILGEGHSLPTILLADITRPTLVMHGGSGAPSMRDAAKAISEAVPNAQFRTLTGQTHGVSPKVIAPILAEFFT